MQTIIIYRPENYEDCQELECDDCFYNEDEGFDKCYMRNVYKKETGISD